jgi:chitinase
MGGTIHSLVGTKRLDEGAPVTSFRPLLGSKVVLVSTANPRTTFCAPIARSPCDNEHDARGSEQNWQGFVHRYLGAELKRQAEATYGRTEVSSHTPVAFRFVTTPNARDIWATRIEWDGDGRRNWQPVTPGTSFRRLDDEDVKRHAAHFVSIGNGSIAIVLPNGEVFHTYEGRPFKEPSRGLQN